MQETVESFDSTRSAAATRRTSIEGATSLTTPWHLAAIVFAATSVIVGLIWDISWHMSIGRDTFWTPAHMAIYTGGAVAGLASGFEVLRRSFYSPNDTRDESVNVWRIFRGPLGGWLCIWGAVAMLTSAPFDDWWHNAYGLDVQILSPPHSVLAVGFLAILLGAMVLAVARQNREDVQADATSGLVVAYTAGLLLTIASIMSYEYQERIMMHSGIFFEVVALVFPLFLMNAAFAVRLRWPATTTAAVYTGIMCLQLWILPMFAASPLLGPIRTQITHMVPLNFPLMVLLPAFLVDVVLHRTESRGAWFRAALTGVTFIVSFAPIQWFFARYLLSTASRNWFFHSNNLPYMMPADAMQSRGIFLPEAAPSLLVAFFVSIVIATVASRLGMRWGSWLRTVKR